MSRRRAILPCSPMRLPMHVRHIIAFAVFLLIALSVKVLVSSPTASAKFETSTNGSMNTLQLQINHSNRKILPVQKVHDMSFVFSDID